MCGDLLLALGAVGAEAALAGEADLTRLDGDGLFAEREAARLMGDFFGVFLGCGADTGLVCWLRSSLMCRLTWFVLIIVACWLVEAVFPRGTLRSASGAACGGCLQSICLCRALESRLCDLQRSRRSFLHLCRTSRPRLGCFSGRRRLARPARRRFCWTLRSARTDCVSRLRISCLCWAARPCCGPSDGSRRLGRCAWCCFLWALAASTNGPAHRCFTLALDRAFGRTP